MLFSFAIIFLCGMILGGIFHYLKLPSLLGMLLTGMLIGPYGWKLIDSSILNISIELRQMALIIILTRAGLNLDFRALKKVGRPALLMCFLPACFEIAGMLLLAPKILGLNLLEAAILGTVIAAVSPAVIVPKMLGLMEKGYGKEKHIPQLIMAGASVDDIFVIVLFTSFLGLAQGKQLSPEKFFAIPVAILLGGLSGFIVGTMLSRVFTKIHMRDTIKVLIIISISFLLVSMEPLIQTFLPFSGLLAVMAMGIGISKKMEPTARRLSGKFSKLWVAAELMLFVLVGASLDVGFASGAGIKTVILIFGVLVFRMVGVMISLLGTSLSKKEKLFCILAYMPKATVQAAIGSIPLSMGLACGNIVLTVAVLSILITAPLGAILIDKSYVLLLEK